MRTITIRECAITALNELEFGAGDFLLGICREAFSIYPDTDRDDAVPTGTAKALYAAVAPDILDSVREEGQTGLFKPRYISDGEMV